MFYVNFTLHIHQLWNLSPLQYDIYYQPYYHDIKRTCVTVLLNCAVLILMLEYAFLFAGLEAAPSPRKSILLVLLWEYI
jgi:hypothetical protein